MQGQLLLAGVPLGNPADASPRLRAALEAADVVAAEDTRKLRRLAADLDVRLTGSVLSYFDGNADRRTPVLIDRVAEGATVVLVTDGGMPAVSDPGYQLVAAALAAGQQVSVLPGPSAVTTAIAVAGIPGTRFCFEGFLPRKAGERRRALAELATQRRIVVFFESPRRLASTLRDAVIAFGPDRSAAVCRELTKTYEEIRRGSLDELAEWATGSLVRGEITVVVAGLHDPPRHVEGETGAHGVGPVGAGQAGAAGEPASADAVSADYAKAAAVVAQMMADGTSRRDAVEVVARTRGLRRRSVYEASLQ